MGVYSDKCGRGGGGKNKGFFEGFLGRIRNLEKNFPFAVIFRLFLGSFEGGEEFLDLGPGKHKDFLLEYTPMHIKT